VRAVAPHHALPDVRLRFAGAMVEGRLRGGSHRLRGPRHARRASRRRRHVGGSGRVGHRRRRAPRRPAHLEDRRDRRIAGRPRGAVASALAPHYTPELVVKATVAFAPGSHIDDQLPSATALTAPGGALSANIALILRGLEAAQPSLDVASLLSPQAAALYAGTLTECIPALQARDSFGGLSPAAIFVPHPDLTALARFLDTQDPSHLKIGTPVLIEQGTRDPIVLPVYTDALARELRASGAKVTYKR
jgi:hypothetical protein